MKTVKQKVYLVVEYNKEDKARVLGVYSNELAAKTKIHRSYISGNSYHVLRKSVQGTEIFPELSKNIIVLKNKE